MSTPILIAGLGAMGGGMAASLVRAGHRVTGFDRDASAMERLRQAGGDIAAPGDIPRAAAEAEIAVIVVVNAGQTEAILFGADGLAAHMAPGSVVVSCATFAPAYAIDFEARLAEKGILYLDAPISGGAGRAAAGTLSVMAAGSPEAFAKARPALDAMAETVFELGDKAGPGSAMKIVNQLLAGVHVAATCEALTFGIGQGIEAEKMIEVISRSAGSSWMFQNRGPFIAEGDYRPHSAVDIFVKDLGIVTGIARDNGLSVVLAETALSRFKAASEAGYGRDGDVSVARVYAEEGGVPLPTRSGET